jgi:leader peptidase (prepilin peptidase)/N-methyltransferase
LELLTGFLLPIMFLSQRDVTRTAIFFSLTCCLLVVSFIDIDTMELPDFLTIGLAGVGLIVSLIFPKIHGTTNFSVSAYRSVFGLLCGTGILFWIGVLGEWIFKKEAIGLGDIKLIGAIGTFCGTKGCIYAIFGGSAAGTLFILPPLLWRLFFFQEKEPSHLHPSLCPFPKPWDNPVYPLR